MKTGSYTITVEEEKKIVSICVRGTFDDAKAGEFHKDYLNQILPLNTSEYLLLLDGVDMDVIDMEMLPKLQISFALYRKSNFKDICFIILNEDVRKQVLRLIRFSGMSDMTDISYIIPTEVNRKIELHLQEVK
jgi:hypothetical protein